MLDSKKFTRKISEKYTKPDIIKAAEELGLKAASTDRTVVLLDNIFEDLEENGVPEKEDMSKLLLAMLATAGILDEKGELIEDAEEKSDESKKADEIPEKLPECYSMADPIDPACKRCKIFTQCLEERKRTMPPCFGTGYERGSEECSLCIEMKECKEAMQNS